MKTLLVSAVFLLGLAHLGSSRLCYICTMAINDGPCLKVANCTGGTPYCGTSRVNGLAMTYMNKFCSAACINASQNFTIISATETCCTTDLCNNDKLGDANSMFADNGGSGLAGGAFLLVTICGLLSAIFTM